LESLKIKKSVIDLLEVASKDFHNYKSKDLEKQNVLSQKTLKELDVSINQIQDRIL